MQFFSSGGKKGKGQVIDLLSLAIPDYKWVTENPTLKFLPKTLAQMIVFEYPDFISPDVSILVFNLTII